MTYRQAVDPAKRSALALCSCGWRHLTADTDRAWQLAHAHALHAHPGEDDGTSRRRATRTRRTPTPPSEVDDE